MKPAWEQASDAIVLERGRLAARPGLDRYVYTFRAAADLPDIGRRGDFLSGPDVFPARLIDRRGPWVSISLKADKPLGPGLGGYFRPNPPTPAPAPVYPGGGPLLPSGAALFLDPHDGWVMSAAEAAGHKASTFDPHYWREVPGADIADHLSPAGLTFVWRPQPDEGSPLIAALVGRFIRDFGRVLIVADAPAELEPLAELEGAVFAGEASPGTPLHPVSLDTKAAEAREARELELAELRNSLFLLKRDEAAVKAKLAFWEDLDELEARFANLGREVARFSGQWEQARDEVERARMAWEEAQAAVYNSGRGLLGWLRKGGPDQKAVQREELSRQALGGAEAAVRAARQEEESTLEEARRLEIRLRTAHLESERWTGRSELTAELDDIRGRQDQVAAQLAASLARPAVTPENFLTEAGVVLALIDDLAPGEILSGQRFPAVLALTDHPPDHDGRHRLAALVLNAERHLVIFGDFTFWPIWSGRAPALEGQPDVPAWSGLLVAEEQEPLKLFLAGDGLFSPEPLPAGGPTLARLELDSGSEAPSENQGIGLRAAGEIGPANPVSALAVARAAVNFAATAPGDEPAVIILTASAAQAGLINLMLRDLAAPDGRIFCGEPQGFIHWPPAPLVILEPAFEAPHLSHPWAWPSFGRQRLMWVWQLAAEQIWLAGRDGWLRRLPEASPLGALWAKAGLVSPDIDLTNPAKEAVPAFWAALDKARQEVWAIVPAFAPLWWRPLEEHFLAAARRRVAVTILTAPPGPDADKDYISQAIRTLSVYGCQVHLVEGLAGFLAVADNAHLTWGHLAEGARGAQVWSGLKSAVLPAAGPEIGEILQLKLINEKMGRRGGGLRACPKCGWPLVVINQDQPRGFGDEQPLKLACLGCQGSKAPRRLDERDPFSSPPRCGLNRDTSYQRVWRNRQEVWACPDHPDGPDCPSFRVRPGDVK